MNSFKRTFLYLLIVILLVTAVSCQTSDNDDTNNNENTNTNESTTANEATGDQTIITFAVSGWERGLYENRVTAFEEAHPDIKIELVSVDEIMGNPSGRVVMSSGGDDSLLRLVQGADIISWYIQPGFVQDGLLLDLAPLMTADDNFDAADYYPGLLEQYQWDGGTWGVPNRRLHTHLLRQRPV